MAQTLHSVLGDRDSIRQTIFGRVLPHLQTLELAAGSDVMTNAINPGVYMEAHRKAILCLCCDTHTLQVRQMLLEHFGYLVFATNSVEDAQNIAEDRCPDMLLMDNSHPEVDLEQVARQVKAKCPGVIAVVLSPYYYGAGKASRSAVDRFVTSNDGPDVLISQIEELLGDHLRGSDSMSQRM